MRARLTGEVVPPPALATGEGDSPQSAIQNLEGLLQIRNHVAAVDTPGLAQRLARLLSPAITSLILPTAWDRAVDWILASNIF